MSQFFGKPYPYRPQRYHAWDVFETAPRIAFLDPLAKAQTFPILNFSEQGLCMECSQPPAYLKTGDVIRSVQVFFADQVLFSGDAKVKHVTRHGLSEKWHYGLRFLEGKLSIPEIFSLRERLQDRTLSVERLRRVQRVPRHGKEFLGQFEVQVFLEEKERKIPVRIENVSEFGFCLSLEAVADVELFASSVFVPDSILEKLSFSVDGKTLFEGRVLIRHVQKEQFRLKAGVFCLDGLSVPFSGFESALKLREAKQGFLLFLEKTEQSEKIQPEFKIALNDFRYFLEAMKVYLEKTELKVQEIEKPQEREDLLACVMDYSGRLLAERIQKLIDNIEKIVVQLNQEESELHRKYFQDQVLELTNGCLVFRRAMEKPLGYPGDYEMMNALYHRSREGNNLWEKLMSFCLNEYPEGPQAVRNRAKYLESKIAQTVAARPDQKTIHILSLACGPCEEVQRFLKSQASRQKAAIHFYLLDQEEKALAYAQNRLYPLASQISPEHGRVDFDFLQVGVKHLLKTPELTAAYPKMDLIYSAGLFDYLQEPVAKKLTKVLLNMLSEKGLLIIGNFKKNYPRYFFSEYASDWFLILRNPEELLRFLPDESWHSRASIEQEANGYTLFLNVQKSSPAILLTKD